MSAREGRDLGLAKSAARTELLAAMANWNRDLLAKPRAADMCNTPTTPNSMNRGHGPDGGVTALGGFAFQFVGMLARILDRPVRKVKSFRTTEIGQSDVGFTSDDTEEEIDRLFGVELFDEDGIEIQIDPDGTSVLCLIQYKYSAIPDSTKNIDKSQLKTILGKMEERFERAKESLRKENVKPCYILATNRSPGPEMQQILDAQAKGEIHAKVEEDADFKRRLENFKWEPVDPDSCRSVIEEASRAFGMLPHEVEDAISRMVGKLLFGVLQGSPIISPTDIEGHLVGFSTPRRLDSPEVREAIRRSIEDDFATKCDVDNEPFGRRDIQEELEDALNQAAFIVLHGKGGNGKTTLLFNVLKQCAADGFFVAADKAKWTSAHWICDEVERWRGNIGRTCNPELAEESILRLMRTTQKRPVLLLALDALDEHIPESDQADIHQILQFFSQEHQRGHAPPRATLIVSCRELQDLSSYFGDSAPGRRRHLRLPGLHIEVNSFSTAEIERLLHPQLWHLEDSTRLRLLKSFTDLGGGISHHSINLPPASLGRSSSLPETLRSSAKNESVNSIHDEVRQALTHPAAWGVFVNSDWTQQQREEVLDGSENGLAKFSEELVVWFDERCQRRCQTSHDEARAILIEAAKATQSIQPAQSGLHWREAGRNEQRSKSQDILRQAVSSGLVSYESGQSLFDFTWRWRHPFLSRYLARRHA